LVKAKLINDKCYCTRVLTFFSFFDPNKIVVGDSANEKIDGGESECGNVGWILNLNDTLQCAMMWFTVISAIRVTVNTRFQPETYPVFCALILYFVKK